MKVESKTTEKEIRSIVLLVSISMTFSEQEAKDLAEEITHVQGLLSPGMSELKRLGELKSRLVSALKN